jgi:hypothetical protein
MEHCLFSLKDIEPMGKMTKIAGNKPALQTPFVAHQLVPNEIGQTLFVCGHTRSNTEKFEIDILPKCTDADLNAIVKDQFWTCSSPYARP